MQEKSKEKLRIGEYIYNKVEVSLYILIKTVCEPCSLIVNLLI